MKGFNDMDEWQQQMRDSVDTIDKLEKYVNLSDSEREALESLTTTWGTTPYFAALMDILGAYGFESHQDDADTNLLHIVRKR